MPQIWPPTQKFWRGLHNTLLLRTPSITYCMHALHTFTMQNHHAAKRKPAHSIAAGEASSKRFVS